MQAMWAPFLIPLHTGSNLALDLALYLLAGDVSPILIPHQTITALSLVLAHSSHAKEMGPILENQQLLF